MRGRFLFDKSRHYTAPPEALWPLVADTARVNELAGVPAYRAVEKPDSDGRVVRHVTSRVGPLPVAWRERFGQWVAPRRLDQVRTFQRGPLEEVRVTFELAPVEGGTRLTLRAEVDWKGVIGALCARSGVFAKEFDQRLDVIGRLDATLVRRAPPEEAADEPEALAPRARARMEAAIADLEHDPGAHGLADRLVHYLTHAPGVELRGIRPRGLANRWQVSEEQAVELCLCAQKHGLLALGWDLLCPRCRGAKFRVTKLDELPEGAHCPSCDVDYGRDFSQNVELTFRPEPWLRELPEGEFCMLGAASTPHVHLQRELAAGDTADVPLAVTPGLYRYRTVEPGFSVDVEVGPDGRMPSVALGEDGLVTAGPPGPPGRIAARNDTNGPLYLVVEDRAWAADALTGERVISMPAFRRLCPEQLLRAGDDAAIRRIAILFTDLTGSTAMYVRMGDAPAYGLVRAHFAYLAERVARHGGFIVKTVGDAVMAAFHDPAEAVRAALAMQDELAAFNEGRADKVILKLGLHQGPCVAVTTGGTLDYFGSTVNTAARLEHHCKGGEVVVSAAVLADADAAAALAGRNVSEEAAELRGLSEPVKCVRVLGS